MKKSRFGFLIGVFAIICTLCPGSGGLADAPALNDHDKKQMADEVKQGTEIAAEMAKDPHTRLVTDKTQIDRVNRIGQKIAAVANTTQFQANYGNDHVYPFTWHFAIVEDKDVNAFSLPGGYVYLNSGLLKLVRSDDELAGVLGHEITHSAHHHISQLTHEESRMSSQLMLGVLAAILAHVPAQDMGNLAAGASMYQQAVQNLKYGQAAERDADHGGVILMQKAGYNPVGMLTFMELLKQREDQGPDIQWGIYQNHPLGAERVAAIQTQLAAMHVAVTPAAVRRVENADVAVVQVVNNQTREVMLGKTALFTLADSDGSRARAAALSLNQALDSGLKLMQVRVDRTTLFAGDLPVVQMTSADAALGSDLSAELLAENAANQLRKALWAQSISENTRAE